MKTSHLRPLLALAVLCLAPFASLAPAAPGDEANAILERIRNKAQMGQTTEAELARELNQLSDLQIKYRSQKPVAAEMLLARAFVYAQVIRDQQMALILFEQVAAEYPGTPAAYLAAETVEAARATADDAPPRPTRSSASPRERSTSASTSSRGSSTPSRMSSGTPEPGSMWPDFSVQDLEGAPLSVGQFRGKVVLVDFWATWCGPCVADMDGLMAMYRRYYDKGFEIIGISLDKDRAPLVNFIRQRRITWPQHFDAGGQLARRYGVTAIPNTFLIDAEGKVIGVNLRGAALERALQRNLEN